MPGELLKRHGGAHHDSNVLSADLVMLASFVYFTILGLQRFLVSRFKKYTSFVPKLLQKLYDMRLFWSISLWFLFLNLVTFRKLILGKVEHIDVVFYTDISKKYARYAYALYPLDILITLRPIPLISTNNYLSMLSIHKWLSRLIVFMFTVHGAIYFYKWILEGVFLRHTFVKIANFYGVVALTLFIVVIFTSIRYVRRKNYNLFYLIHISTVWLSLPLITLHARPGVLLITIICLLLMGYMVICKILTTFKISDLEIITPDFSSLTLVRMPSSIISTQKAETPSDIFYPGSHVRISQPLTYLKSWFNATHPFSIASLSTDDTLDLIIKKQTFTIDPLKEYSISFANPSINKEFFKFFDNNSPTQQRDVLAEPSGKDIIIVVGGSGISFGLPFFRYLVPFSEGNQNRVKLVWMIRNKYDLYILEKANIIEPYEDVNNLVVKDEFRDLIEVYLTNGESDTSSQQKIIKGKSIFSKLFSGFSSFKDSRYHQVNGDDVNEFELESINSNDDDNDNGDVDDLSRPDTTTLSKSNFVHHGRPQLSNLLNNFLFADEDVRYLDEDSDNEEIIHTKRNGGSNDNDKFVISCGPSTLVDDCVRWCKHNDVNIIDEYYEM